MTQRVNRRAALGLGAAAAGAVAAVGSGVLAGTASAATRPAAASTDSRTPAQRVADVYQAASGAVGGTWTSYISLTNADNSITTAVDQASDTVVEAESVNKIPVATAVLDKVDRGLLTLDQTVQVTADIVITDGDGIFRLDGAYPSTITIGHALAVLLTVSDDTAVRLCGLVAPAAEINQILVAKGFPHTQVDPVANPNRFYLGQTTPREMHDLLRALVNGTPLSAASTSYLLNIIRSPIAFTDGIRREMSSDERARIATKAGWLDDVRNEAGIIFDAAGNAEATYALFANNPTGADDFGATNPLVQARAVMGRAWLDILAGSTGSTSAMAAKVRPRTFPAAPYRPSNGG